VVVAPKVLPPPPASPACLLHTTVCAGCGHSPSHRHVFCLLGFVAWLTFVVNDALTGQEIAAPVRHATELAVERLSGWACPSRSSLQFDDFFKATMSLPPPPDAAMADVWSIPIADNEEPQPTPPPSPRPPPPLSVKGEPAEEAPQPQTHTQIIKEAALTAFAAAAAPPVPPATTTGYYFKWFTACNQSVTDAVETALKATKQTGYFAAQAAAHRSGKLGVVDEAIEHDATISEKTANVYADLAAKAAVAACVTRVTAVAACYITNVTYQYDQVGDRIKRDIQVEYDEAVEMHAEFLSDFPAPPKF